MALVLITATSCEKIDQEPTIQQNGDSLTDYGAVLNAAYYYQLGTVTPMAVMGDFRADNAYMDEAPYSDFDVFDANLTSMEDQFFGPFYTALYRSILSSNTRFLRGLSYFKLVKVFGDVTVNLSDAPDVISDLSVLTRQSASSVYNNVIIPDLEAAMAGLSANSSDGRATSTAAEGILGKVYMQMGNYGMAESHLANVINGASAAGYALMENYEDVFGAGNDGNDEIIFATQISSSVQSEYGFSEFWGWYGGGDTKSLTPLDPAQGPTIIAAFEASPGDLRSAICVDSATNTSPKYNQEDGPDHDWIELRLADVLLMYAEAMNENGASAADALGVLDDIRTRAGLAPLDPTSLNSTDLVRNAIANERRLELAFEGQRWFDLVRTGAVDDAMGEAVNSAYHLFPIPISEILASFNTITQNDGY